MLLWRSLVYYIAINPLPVANGKFRRGLCMRNLVLTDIYVRETSILQTGISLIKNIYQSEIFFDLRVSILYKLLVSEISPGVLGVSKL